MEHTNKNQLKNVNVRNLFSKESSNNDAFITPWCLVHYCSGFLIVLVLFILNFKTFPKIFILGNVIHFIYEIVDITINKYSLLNSFGDQVFACLGMLSCYYILFVIKQTTLIIPITLLILYFLIDFIFFKSRL